MKTKLLFCMAIAMLLFNACSKEQHKVEPNSNTESLKYKIDPKKLSEIRGLQIALKSGQNLRIVEETFTEEEFYLYAEAIINSLLTNFEDEPEITRESSLSISQTPTEFTLTQLLDLLNNLEMAITNDLANFVIDEPILGTKYIHLIDLDWTNGLNVYYIIGANTTIPPNVYSFSMTLDTISCDTSVLNGFIQHRIINWLNTTWASYAPYQYRPNLLFNSTWNPNWTNNYIPAYTYTEVSSKTYDYADPQDRSHYIYGVNPPKLWHRVVQGANTPAPCLPDVLPGGPPNQLASPTYYANLMGTLALQSNPNQYGSGNRNGLVLIGFSVEADHASSASLQIPNAPQEQYEYWHKVTYLYGRQIELGQSPVGNE